eukprot:3941222-Rhodomonas_salina.3
MNSDDTAHGDVQQRVAVNTIRRESEEGALVLGRTAWSSDETTHSGALAVTHGLRERARGVEKLTCPGDGRCRCHRRRQRRQSVVIAPQHFEQRSERGGSLVEGQPARMERECTGCRQRERGSCQFQRLQSLSSWKSSGAEGHLKTLCERTSPERVGDSSSWDGDARVRAGLATHDNDVAPCSGV